MSKKIFNIALALCCSASILSTSCIEESIPTATITEDQLESSEKALEAQLWGMPAFMNAVGAVSANNHFDWGYGSIMHIRDLFTEDMAKVSSDYDWYPAWQQNVMMGEDQVYTQFIWTYYWKYLKTVNKMISSIDLQKASEDHLGYLGAAYAFRAFLYLDMARMYEFLPNDKTSSVNKAGNDVKGLTVPIVRENITEAEARKNPRVDRQTMAAFILEDLDKAEMYIEKLPFSDKILPHLDVVYGLKARYYMWLEDYVSARQYARKAIEATATQPMTEAECLDVTKGFNDISKWMWGSQLTSDSQAVMSGALNWVSWCSNETTFGYSGAAPFLMIGASLYDRMPDTDFRKKLWKAPFGTALSGKTPFVDPSFESRLNDYSSVKFRPAEGDFMNPFVGAASAYPLMRVEEMYLIEAEAAAHISDSEGRELINKFMTTYRDPYYITALSGDALVEEIVFQKRIELWGEGQTFFDIKRLNYSVTRGYVGTNFSDLRRFNTEGRPAWMNICITITEKNNNTALIGFENPDPSDVYPVWKEEK